MHSRNWIWFYFYQGYSSNMHVHAVYWGMNINTYARYLAETERILIQVRSGPWCIHKAEVICVQFGLWNTKNGTCSVYLQIGNTESYFGRTLCSASTSAISKNARGGDNISVSVINYEGWHVYVFIVEISINLKDTYHAILFISFQLKPSMPGDISIDFVQWRKTEII